MIIKESLKKYLRENSDIDWDNFDDEEDYEWDGSWAGREDNGEDYAEFPDSEEMIWKHHGNQNIHRDEPGEEGTWGILAQGDKDTWSRRMARSLRPSNSDSEKEFYKGWEMPEDDTEEDIAYINNKAKNLHESKLSKIVYENVKRKLRRLK
jgi:hypothetical protein